MQHVLDSLYQIFKFIYIGFNMLWEWWSTPIVDEFFENIDVVYGKTPLEVMFTVGIIAIFAGWLFRFFNPFS